MIFRKIKELLLDDRFIFFVILINSFTIFGEGFTHINFYIIKSLAIIDSAITVIFILEAIVKIRYFTWSIYIKSNWNKLDFVLVLLSLPSIILIFFHPHYTDLSFLLVLRISRVFKFFRFFKFIPGIESLVVGVRRALKTSVFVFIGFFVYNFISSVFSCYLFKDISPELFGNPLDSFYSTFRIFTVEGWYEIPDQLSINMDYGSEILIKTYFILILITGGILGLSLVNSIFVDSMVSDNNDELERKVDELNQKIEKLIQIQSEKKD